MSKRAFRILFALEIVLSLFLFAGCGTTMPQGIQQARIEAAQKIAAEPPGDYFIGHRYFKGSVFKFWGYVRQARTALEHGAAGRAQREGKTRAGP